MDRPPRPSGLAGSQDCLVNMHDSAYYDEVSPTRDPATLITRKTNAAVDADGAGARLKVWRLSTKQNQAEVADLLGITQQYLSQIENGRRAFPIDLRRKIVDTLGIAAAEIGLTDPLSPARRSGELEPEVALSQQQWRQERRWLNSHRSQLSQLAMKFYPSSWRIQTTGLISQPSWQLQRPMELGRLKLALDEGPQEFTIRGSEPESIGVRPLRAIGANFDTYTAAIRQLDRPYLFESRPSYRILGGNFAAQELSFGLANYFDKLDLSEAVGHELARACMSAGDVPVAIGNIANQVPFRNLIGDPFNFTSRAVIPAITTLTLRLRRYPLPPTFLLHWRDPAKVATAGGIYDVIPAGEFQPSSMNPWDRRADFDIWRNIVREYSEELLGTPEHDGTRSQPIEYETWPLFRNLEESKNQGKTQVWLLGLGLDALTLATTIMTVVIMEDEEFNSIFRDAVEFNDEGNIARPGGGRPLEGVEFTAAEVQRMLMVEPMASPGAACIALAWKHRAQLLGME
jgi:transcriptional regulator with XRE-family HTH domain